MELASAVVEAARPSQRAAFACATGVVYGLGGMLFALLAWRVRYWRKLLRVIYVPALLLPLYWILVDESPRWLYATGRRRRTGAVLRKAAHWNKVVVGFILTQFIISHIAKIPWVFLAKQK